jgi:hypothetical protein
MLDEPTEKRKKIKEKKRKEKGKWNSPNIGSQK